MRKINVSTKNIGKFAGKWVAIDPIKDPRELSPPLSKSLIKTKDLISSSFQNEMKKTLLISFPSTYWGGKLFLSNSGLFLKKRKIS